MGNAVGGQKYCGESGNVGTEAEAETMWGQWQQRTDVESKGNMWQVVYGGESSWAAGDVARWGQRQCRDTGRGNGGAVAAEDRCGEQRQRVAGGIWGGSSWAAMQPPAISPCTQIQDEGFPAMLNEEKTLSWT